MLLSDRAIDALAEMICGGHGSERGFKWDNFTYRSSYYLTKFFKDCGLIFEHNGETRVSWVRSVLQELNTNNEINIKLPSDNLRKVILCLIEDIQFSRPENYQGALDDINRVLSIKDDLQIEKRGNKHILVSIDSNDYDDNPSNLLVKPLGMRIYIEDIDNLCQVAEVSPVQVSEFLDNGYLNISEDSIQKALEKIFFVPFHKNDWGGEINDLYTSNVFLRGTRLSAAFLLKGKGLRNNTLEIRDCGKNGDQIVRLFDSPSQLYVVQFVGNIAENVIKDVESKTKLKCTSGEKTYYCIINGQDTARILYAYDFLK